MTRRTPSAAEGLLAVALAAVAIVALAHGGSGPTPPARRLALGFAMHPWGPASLSNIAKLDAARAAGAEVVRLDFGWAPFEAAGKGRYDMTYLTNPTTGIDRVVDGAAARGMKVVLTVFTTPCWASSMANKNCSGDWGEDGSGVHYHLPADASDMADVINLLAARYRARSQATRSGTSPTTPTTRGLVRARTRSRATRRFCVASIATRDRRGASPRSSAALSPPRTMARRRACTPSA